MSIDTESLWKKHKSRFVTAISRFEFDAIANDAAEAAMSVEQPPSKIAYALEAAAEILANFKGEGERTKLEEWEACYAMLFTQMNELVMTKRTAAREIPPVSEVANGESMACEEMDGGAVRSEQSACQDEGCPHYGKAIKCEPKPDGCIATVPGQPDECSEEHAKSVITRILSLVFNTQQAAIIGAIDFICIKLRPFLRLPMQEECRKAFEEWLDNDASLTTTARSKYYTAQEQVLGWLSWEAGAAWASATERESSHLSERDKLEVIQCVEKAVLSGRSWNGGGVLEAIMERFDIRRRS